MDGPTNPISNREEDGIMSAHENQDFIFSLQTDTQNLKSDMEALEHEFAKFKVWWMETFNTLTHAIQVEIGVRNNKIKELNEKIIKLFNAGKCLEKQVKTLTEQVELNSQWRN